MRFTGLYDRQLERIPTLLHLLYAFALELVYVPAIDPPPASSPRLMVVWSCHNECKARDKAELPGFVALIGCAK